MKCEFIKSKGTWRDVANSARTTINMEKGENEPTSHWKRKMLLSEHSPIRQITIKAKWYDMKYWVSVHFTRHWLGITHWVRTQRSDRSNMDRDRLEQAALIEHEFEANAQAIINISRRRLCNQASRETREAWIAFLNEIKEDQPELVDACVPDCVYRGHCYEYKSCNYHKSEAYKVWLEKYRKGIND